MIRLIWNWAQWIGLLHFSIRTVMKCGRPSMTRSTHPRTPTQHSDFRPISITPILTRMMERTVVRTFLYPALLAPPPSLTFQINLLSAPLVPHLLPSFPFSTPSPACSKPTHMSLSYPSNSQRLSTLSATQHCCLRCQSWIYRRTCN